MRLIFSSAPARSIYTLRLWKRCPSGTPPLVNEALTMKGKIGVFSLVLTINMMWEEGMYT